MANKDLRVIIYEKSSYFEWLQAVFSSRKR